MRGLKDIVDAIVCRSPTHLTEADIVLLLQCTELRSILESWINIPGGNRPKLSDVIRDIATSASRGRHWPFFAATTLREERYKTSKFIAHKLLQPAQNESLLGFCKASVEENGKVEWGQLYNSDRRSRSSARFEPLLCEAGKLYRACLLQDGVQAFLTAFFRFAKEWVHDTNYETIRSAYLSQRQKEMQGLAKYESPTTFIMGKNIPDGAKETCTTAMWADKVHGEWKSGAFVEFMQDQGAKLLTGKSLCNLLATPAGEKAMNVYLRAIICELTRYISRSTLASRKGNAKPIEPRDMPYRDILCGQPADCPNACRDVLPFCEGLWRSPAFADAVLNQRTTL